MSDTANVPLVVLNFNQLTYTRNLVNWWRWSAPGNPIYVVDNASTYPPLLDYYTQDGGLVVNRCPENKAPENLRRFLDDVIHPRFSHYVVSDADISPHPATPADFLAVLRHAIDELGYHHAGFGLITDDLPPWTIDREAVLRNETAAKSEPVSFEFGGRTVEGWKAAIDTTFAMFSTANGGWYAPMNIDDWTNSLRVFDAFHLPWYLDAERVNPEMDNYFRTAKFRDHGPVSAGKNNYRPPQYQGDDGGPRRPRPGAGILMRLRSRRG
jgi:hypothetical protein